MRLRDLILILLLLVVVAGLADSAISNVRSVAKKMSCQNNLKQTTAGAGAVRLPKSVPMPGIRQEVGSPCG